MDTVMSGAGQPVVVGHEKGGHCHNNVELISCGQMHDEARHNDHSVRGHALHHHDVQERFGLRSLEEMTQLRREMCDIKGDISLKLIEDGHKTRDLIRDQETARMREDLNTLRMQLIAAGIVPAALK